MPTMLLVNSRDMPTEKTGGRQQRWCLQCGEPWFSHRGKKPTRCPNCNSRAWDREPKKRGPKPKRKDAHKRGTKKSRRK